MEAGDALVQLNLGAVESILRRSDGYSRVKVDFCVVLIVLDEVLGQMELFVIRSRRKVERELVVGSIYALGAGKHVRGGFRI